MKRTRAQDISHLSSAEQQKRIDRREKNKISAQKSRQKKVDETDRLLDDVEKLGEETSSLKGEIEQLTKQKEELTFIANMHKLSNSCQLQQSTPITSTSNREPFSILSIKEKRHEMPSQDQSPLLIYGIFSSDPERLVKEEEGDYLLGIEVTPK